MDTALPEINPPARGCEPAPARGLPKVLLTSRSPRRQELLREAGIPFEVIESGVDDGHLMHGAVAGDQWVAALAYLKAVAAAENGGLLSKRQSAAEPEVILGADTVVLDEGEIIGQPRDRDDAARILARLINGNHSVVTGVALIDRVTGRRDLFVDRADVEVGPVSEHGVAEYLDSGQWRGKAGAYNLSERLAAGWPIRFRGDPGTIMGLPIRSLVPRLHAFSRV